MSKNNTRKKYSILIALTIFFSFLGFLDATYLSFLHFKQIPPPCQIVKGCEAVLTSRYATFFGIPVALLGSGYYLLFFVRAIAFFEQPTKQKFQLLAIIAIAGAVVSFGLFAIQALILHAFCQYCIASEIISFLLLTFSLLLLRLNYEPLAEKVTLSP